MTKNNEPRISHWGTLFILLIAAISFKPLFVFPQSSNTTEVLPVSGSVIGVLLAEDNSPRVKTEIRLIIIRLVGLDGQEILDLPPNKTYIVDSDGKAVALAVTASSGKFEFKDVPSGRYSLAVHAEMGGEAGQCSLKESSGMTVFFDVTGTQKTELGKLKAGTFVKYY